MEIKADFKEKRGYSALLQYKSYLLLWSGNTISRFGDSLDSIAIMWMMYKMTSSFVLMGTVMAVNAVPSLLFGLAAGVFVDRSNKRVIMITVDFLRALSTAVIAALFMTGRLMPWYIFVFSFFNSTCEVFATPARACLRQSLVGKEHYMPANSLWETASQTASIIGTGISAFILGIWGIGVVVLIDAFTFLISSLTALFMKQDDIPASSQEKLTAAQFFSELAEGLGIIRTNRTILITIIMICSVNVVLAPFNVLLPAYSDRILLSGAKGYSMIEAFFTAGIILGSIVIGQLGSRFKKSSLILSGFLAVGLGIGLLSIIRSLPLAVIICALSGTFIPFIGACATTILQETTPPEKAGRVFSTTGTLCLLGLPLGYAVSGLIAAGMSIELTYLSVGVLIVLICIPAILNKEFCSI